MDKVQHRGLRLEIGVPVRWKTEAAPVGLTLKLGVAITKQSAGEAHQHMRTPFTTRGLATPHTMLAYAG